MTEHFVLAKLFLLAIFLINICGNVAYQPPLATVQPLHPKGIRISVPDENGISLVAFHVKFNEDFYSLEAGQIARDIIKVRDGRWTYEDRDTQLKRNDMIYYWVHVVYNGLGYNLLDQSHRVTDFYNYDGTLYIGTPDIGQTVPSGQNCTGIPSTWIVENGKRRQACSRLLIFEENFDNFDNTKWNLFNRFAGLPDNEFVVYLTNEIMSITDGRLHIKPSLLDSKYGTSFTTSEHLTVQNCTSEIDSDCQRRAFGFSILPPIISGRIDTKEKFEFRYGRVEIRAKLPHGDWVYPLITLDTVDSPLQFKQHREIKIAFSVGNEELKSSKGESINYQLAAGGLTKFVKQNKPENTNHTLIKRVSSQHWSDNFHIFEIEWKSGLIKAKVDGVQYGEQVQEEFGDLSYLTLGVAVGGFHEFEDYARSNGYVKPWRNVEAKALYNFYRAKDKWYPTWDSRTELQVDYVKVWAFKMNVSIATSEVYKLLHDLVQYNVAGVPVIHEKTEWNFDPEIGKQRRIQYEQENGHFGKYAIAKLGMGIGYKGPWGKPV